MTGKDSGSIWLYPPSFPLAIVVATIYLVPTLQYIWLIIRYRSWYMICILIGALFEVVGYVFRAVSANDQSQVAPYAVSSSLIVLAPIFVAAGDYLLVSQLIKTVLTDDRQSIFHIPGAWFTRIFVTCDVLTLVIQGTGSAIASSGNWVGSDLTTGQNLLIAGLAAQVVTFSIFLTIIWKFQKLSFHYSKESTPPRWTRVLRAIYVTSSMIITRCIYRLIEFATGIHGYLFSHEWPYYVLEGLPMLIALLAFGMWFPPKYLTEKSTKTSHVDVEK